MRKSPLESRKLVGYLLADICWTALIGYGLYRQDGMGGVLLGMVLVKGFVEVGYILGQSYVDSFVQLAEVAIHQVHKTADVPEEPTTPNPS